MANIAANQEREIRVAVERVVGFAQKFGEAHLNLACHAAFPLSLTPDFLYQIWANFVPEAPWTAVARILLSRLCKQVASEMYEMDNSVRNLLLRELKVQFGQERFEFLGEFLLEYVGQRLTEDDPDTQDLRQAQEWTALAYTKPEQAARELARELSDHVQQEDIGEVLRLNSLVETLSEPLIEAGFELLVIYAKGSNPFVIGDKQSYQDKVIEENKDKLKDLILEQFIAQEYSFELDKHPEDYDTEGIKEVLLAENEEIHVKIINNTLESFEENTFILSLEIEIEFSIEVNYYDWDAHIPEIQEDVPCFEHIFSNQVVQGNAVVEFWISDDFSETEFESLELNIDQPIEVNDQNIKIPNNLELQVFEFETITINARGKEIKRELKQARYFREILSLEIGNDFLLGNDGNLGKDIYLEMIYIPGGEFLMGSKEKESKRNERPQHQVNVQPFYMSKYPIAQAQWREVASLPQVNRELKLDPSRFKGNNRPVEQVSLYDAVEFCDRLSKRTNKKYRLPSEAEWEYACRAGTSTLFNFGETITSDLTNYDGTVIYKNEPKVIRRGETNEVDKFAPNGLGLYDMHGNVREWCGDSWHETYQKAPSNGSTWINKNTLEKVIRGGSWMSLPDLCRSAYRGKKEPKINNCSNFGFRVVCAM